MARAAPDTRDRYAHFVMLTTRVSDNDVYDHVNNAVYYSYFDTAITGYLIAAGVMDFQRDTMEFVIAENGCHYFSPVGFPDRLHCGLRVTHLGTSSARVEMGLFRNDEPVASAQGFFVQVTCDRATHRPIPMPAAFRAKLELLRV